jgi:benzil reductase ((S)-benzoin forming)
MNYFIITGTGKGIGKSLAEGLLQDSGTFVIGISRHQTINHESYRHFNIDLSQLEKLISSLPEIFPDLKVADRICLVNNAGVLGEIGYIGEKQPQDFDYTFSVNVTAPAILMNSFLEKYAGLKAEKIILNISSGAGKYPLDGWASYCASKAALDLFSQTVQIEQDLRKSDVRVFSLAPGIVDTEMQNQIRHSPEGQFSNVARFQEYKNSGSLTSPETVAQKLKKLLLAPPAGLKVVCRIDDLA